jgi:hypothetical protein
VTQVHIPVLQKDKYWAARLGLNYICLNWDKNVANG